MRTYRWITMHGHTLTSHRIEQRLQWPPKAFSKPFWTQVFTDSSIQFNLFYGLRLYHSTTLIINGEVEREKIAAKEEWRIYSSLKYELLVRHRNITELCYG